MRRLILVAVVAVIAAARPAVAQLGPLETAVSAELVGHKASEVIDRLKQASQSILDQATQAGNALLSRAANEGNVLAQNATFQLQGLLDTTFDHLNDQQQRLVIEAEKMRRDLAAMGPKIYEMKDTLVLDLNRVVERLPFVKEKFFVQAVRGIAFLPSSGNFEITAYASTLGVEEGQRTKVQLLIDGKAVELSQVDYASQRGAARMTVPNAALAPRFKERTLAVVPTTLRFTVERDHGWWIFGSTETHVFDVPVFLSLYPPLAGTAQVSVKVSTYGWAKVDNKEQTYTTPNRHCSSNCRGEPTRGPNHIEFAVTGGGPPPKVGYLKLAKPQLDCLSGPCGGWAAVSSVGLTDFDTRAHADWDTWTMPTTWRLRTEVWQYKVVSEADWAMSKPLDLGFNQLASVLVPKDRNFISVKVTTFTGAAYEMLPDRPDALLDYQGKGDAGVDDKTQTPLERITWKVAPPTLN